MELNNSARARTISINELGMMRCRKSVTGHTPDHECEISFSTTSTEGVKKYDAICDDIFDRKL